MSKAAITLTMIAVRLASPAAANQKTGKNIIKPTAVRNC